jgi:hypothetical protein
MGAACSEGVQANSFFADPGDEAVVSGEDIDGCVAQLSAWTKHEDSDITDWNLGDGIGLIVFFSHPKSDRVLLSFYQSMFHVKPCKAIAELGQ